MESFLNRYRNITVLLLVILAQVLLLAVQVKNDQDVHLIRVWTVTAAVTPMRAHPGGLPAAAASAFVRNYITLHDADAENRRLQAEVTSGWKIENIFLKNELNFRLDRAKALAGVSRRTRLRRCWRRPSTSDWLRSNSKVVFVDRGLGRRADRAVWWWWMLRWCIVGRRICGSHPLAVEVLLVTDADFAAGVVSQKQARGTSLGARHSAGQGGLCALRGKSRSGGVVLYLGRRSRVSARLSGGPGSRGAAGPALSGDPGGTRRIATRPGGCADRGGRRASGYSGHPGGQSARVHRSGAARNGRFRGERCGGGTSRRFGRSRGAGRDRGRQTATAVQGRRRRAKPSIRRWGTWLSASGFREAGRTFAGCSRHWGRPIGISAAVPPAGAGTNDTPKKAPVDPGGNPAATGGRAPVTTDPPDGPDGLTKKPAQPVRRCWHAAPFRAATEERSSILGWDPTPVRQPADALATSRPTPHRFGQETFTRRSGCDGKWRYHCPPAAHRLGPCSTVRRSDHETSGLTHPALRRLWRTERPANVTRAGSVPARRIP